MADMVAVEADLRGITNVMGTWSELIDMLEDTDSMETLSSLGAEAAVQAFNEGMDIAARGDAASLGHMYDWEQLGSETGRLWRVIIGGTASTKIVTWDYKPSTRPVPRNVNPTDTRRTEAVFRWKAPMMELGTRVSISPTQPHGWLAIPTKEPVNTPGKSRRKAGTMWFTRHTQNLAPNEKAVGQFTQRWMTHFGTVAIKIVEEVVVEDLEQYIDTYEEVYRELPAPKVNPKPKTSSAKVKSTAGRKAGSRKNKKYMNKQKAKNTALKVQRIGDGLE